MSTLKLWVFSVAAALVLGVYLGWTIRGAPNDQDVGRHLQERDFWRGQAQGWYSLASTMQTRADTVEKIIIRREAAARDTTDHRLAELREERPDCLPVIAACEERVEAERRVASSWRDQLEDQKRISAALRASAQASSRADTAASEAVQELSKDRRSFWQVLTRPRVGVGAMGGYCYVVGDDGTLERKACAGAGLTLQWHLGR